MIKLLILIFTSGLIFGSFYNVVGLRMPKEKSIAFPNSHCPQCKQSLSFRDNIPVISYVLLKGKCRNCQLKISKIYPVIELLTGLLFLFAAYKMDQFNLFISLLLVSLVIIITITDIHYYIIPNKLLFFFMTLFIIIRIIQPLNPWYDSLLGFLISYLLLFILIIISRGGIGAGDMKLLAVLGFFTGIKVALLGFVLAILIGGLYGVYLLITQKKTKSDYVPFGPFIGFGVLMSYFYHVEIINLYITAIFK